MRRTAAALLAALLLGACAPAARPDAGPPPTDATPTEATPTPTDATATPTDATPAVEPPEPTAVVPNDPTDLERVAWLAWLEMEAARLRTGRYDTEALLDLALPSGVRWTVTRIAADDYALRVDRDGDAAAYRVAPAGVAPFEGPRD
ncbi:MAG: hypothetical protein RI554_00460 [Trueperaceae bacterium]|nr:hypothetical protein [Trueperaceae bacterium]